MTNKMLPFLMKELNCKEINSLTNRIFLQKKIYLLQKIGFNLGYSYKWFRYGPYSVALNVESRSIGSNPSELNVVLNEEQKHFLNIFFEFSKENENNLKFWETAASIVFLKEEHSFLSEESLINKLLELKSHLNKMEVEEIFKKLKLFKII